MDRKRKKTKRNVELVDPRKVTEPINILLSELYDACHFLYPNEITSRLNAAIADLDREEGWLRPIDTEVIWLILGYLCAQNIANEDLRLMAEIIEKEKLYYNFGPCCIDIMQMSNLNNSEKKTKLEKLVQALDKTTALYLTVASNSAETIPLNFFLNLYNTAQSSAIQVLKIQPEIVNRLKLIHLMFTDKPPDDIANLNVVPTHQDIFRSSQVFLRPNFIRRTYPDLETYRDVHFRLLMEDFMQPLREGMTKLINGKIEPKSIPELRVYEKTVLTFFNNSHFVPVRETSWQFYLVQFQKLSMNTEDWIVSRRLIHGSLVCLWDGRNELIVASVADR